MATFGVQKLRGKSTKRALRDAAILGGGAYGFGKLAATGAVPGVTTGQGILGNIGQGSAFSSLGVGAQTTGQQNFLQKMLGQKGLTAEEVKAAGLTGKEATAGLLLKILKAL